MEKYFTAYIHKEAESCYGVNFHDFPGVTAAADGKGEALRKAREALQLAIDVMFERGDSIPNPTENADVPAEYDDVIGVALIPAEIPRKNKRINISIAEHVLNRVDRYAKSHGETRSGLLSRAAQEYIGMES